jgi:hypothetical protein
MWHRRRQRFIVLLAITGTLIALCPQSSQAQSESQATAFVQHLYHLYDPFVAADQDVSKLPNITGELAPSIFSPSLLHLIRRDQRINRGYVPTLDFDPLVNSNGFYTLKLKSLRVTKDDAKKATAYVTVILYGRSPSESSAADTTVNDLRLHLIWLPQGWRTDDIESKETPSLRKLLQ